MTEQRRVMLLPAEASMDGLPSMEREGTDKQHGYSPSDVSFVFIIDPRLFQTRPRGQIKATHDVLY